jgi:ribosomal protein L12E/L44/L45/RPP1/RPP2
MADRRYEVRVAGRVSQHARDAFTGLDVDEVTAETVISGLVHEDDDLHELLAKVQSLGLHVVSVQQVAP